VLAKISSAGSYNHHFHRRWRRNHFALHTIRHAASLAVKADPLAAAPSYAASGAAIAAAFCAGLEMILGPEGAAPNWPGSMALVGVYSLIGAFCAATFWLFGVRSDRST
jgi:hypothetical protein